MDQELIEELYQSLILEHSKNPRNFGVLDNCYCHEKGKNASCGDQLDIYVSLDENNIISDIKFTGEGCAIFVSSASLMTQLLKGKSVEQSIKILSDFVTFIMEDDTILNEDYAPLHIFENVKNFPLRVKCALLPWRTLQYLLNQSKPTTIKE